MLVSWNDTQCELSHDELIHELFERQAEQRPQALAIEFEGARLSYEELNAKANQLAHHLRSQGVRPDDRVALCLERSVEMVIAMLATLKAGGAYVPLDPSYPTERLQYMLKDAAPKVLLTQQRLDEFAWEGSTENLSAQELGLRSSHLAYVIYTSGSSGKPKGVMVEHSSVVNFVGGLERRIYQKVPGCQNIAWNSSFGFDMSVKAWGQLLMGRAVFLVPEAVRFNPESLVEFIHRHRIDAIECTPSHLRAMLDAGLMSGAASPIRAVLVGGEAIDPAMWEQLAGLRERVAFFNMYGPTEATVDATLGLITEGRVNVGVPMPNAQIYILDEHSQLVPVGVSGEIYIGGAGVARGYLNRPELTEQRFLRDPFSGEPGARMYRTGDLGRWAADGTIEVSGRNDFQVKIRGYRIELGEIEAQLMRVAGVRQAVVVGREDRPGVSRLVAYVVGQVLEPAALRAQLSAVLPEYMVPAAYVHLSALPLTANGKLDRKALPAPEGAAFVQNCFAPPDGEIEQALAQIWSELLGVERVGRQDNFLELGGHSLLGVRLISRVRQRLGVELPLHVLFAKPVLSELAEQVAQAARSTLSIIPLVDRSEPLALSFAQERLWFIAQMDARASAAYHIPGRIEIARPLG